LAHATFSEVCLFHLLELREERQGCTFVANLMAGLYDHNPLAVDSLSIRQARGHLGCAGEQVGIKLASQIAHQLAKLVSSRREHSHA
jgi:hypothetical protein